MPEQNPPRILCVEDDPGTAETLVNLLGLLPALVEVAPTGDAAVEMLIDPALRDDPFRVIILDMWVPRAAGEQVDARFALNLLTTLQQAYQLLPPDTPTIVFTGHDSYELCNACLHAGATYYLPKFDARTELSNADSLFELCRKLLSPPPPRAPDPVFTWLSIHLNELINHYGGRFVAAVDDAAGLGGVSGHAVGQYRIVGSGATSGEVRSGVLRDRVLRWQTPRIIRIPTWEDLRHG